MTPPVTCRPCQSGGRGLVKAHCQRRGERRCRRGGVTCDRVPGRGASSTRRTTLSRSPRCRRCGQATATRVGLIHLCRRPEELIQARQRGGAHGRSSTRGRDPRCCGGPARMASELVDRRCRRVFGAYWCDLARDYPSAVEKGGGSLTAWLASSMKDHHGAEDPRSSLLHRAYATRPGSPVQNELRRELRRLAAAR